MPASKLPAAVAIILTLAPSAVRAEKLDPTRAFSLTHSPIHVLLSTMEVTGEFCVGRKHGVAAIGALGVPLGVVVVELGGSYRLYALGDFDRGIQLGGEFIWSGGTNGYESVSLTQYSLMAGGKFTFDFGLTMEGQVGPTWLDGELGPMINLNIGWSFGEKRW